MSLRDIVHSLILSLLNWSNEHENVYHANCLAMLSINTSGKQSIIQEIDIGHLISKTQIKLKGKGYRPLNTYIYENELSFEGIQLSEVRKQGLLAVESSFSILDDFKNQRYRCVATVTVLDHSSKSLNIQIKHSVVRKDSSQWLPITWQCVNVFDLAIDSLPTCIAHKS